MALVRRMVFFALRWSFLPWLHSFWRQRGKTTILLYHDIPPDAFSRHLAYIERRYVLVSLSQYLEAAAQGRSLGREKYLVVTFDDGLRGNFALRELFARHPGKVTLYLCSAIVGTRRGFWFLTENLDSGPLKRVSNAARLTALERVGFRQEAECPARQALSDEEVLGLAAVADIGSHTRFHPCLPCCQDDEAAGEIAGSREELETRYHLRVRTLSYPNGDYCDRDIAQAKAAGYAAGITVDHGVNDQHTDPFRLRRISVNDTTDINEFIVKASGLWGALTGVFVPPRHGRRSDPSPRKPPCA